MALWDLLVNAGNNVKQGVGGLYDKIRPTQAVITPIQQAENGGVDVQRTLELALAQPKTFGQRLGGRTVNVDIETLNPETNQMEVNRISKFQPGLFNDISAGAKENFVTGFAAPNWEQDKTADGRQKGLGYRIGEGLGTFGRFAESPLGRGLLMAGIVGASGGSGLEALAYGGGAGMLNQQARMKDKMYRNELEKMGFDTSTIRGYVGDDTFNKIYQSKQLQDNAEYRNALLASNQRNQDIANEIAKEKFSYQKASDAADRALKKEQIDVQRQRYANNLNKLSSKDLTAYRDNLATIKDVEAGLNLIEQNPNAYSLVKGALPAWATNRIDPKGIQTRTQIDNITAVYRKWLTGAQMSDAERKAYERFLPAPTDNYATIKAKLQGMRDSIERKNSILMQGANEYQNMIDTEDNDPLGVR